MSSPHVVSLVLALALPMSLAACGGSPAEQLADSQADLMNQMAVVIEGIETTEDFENSREELRLLANELMALGPKWELMADEGLTEDEAETVLKGNKRLAEATNRYGVAMAKLVNKPELMMRISEIMQESGDSADR